MKDIDARGLACPGPVLQVKAAVEEEESLTAVKVIVDNDAASQNVTRYLESQGFETSLEKDGEDFIIAGRLSDRDAPRTVQAESADTDRQKIMVLIATDRLGHGSDELGLKLMTSFIKTLAEMGPDLWRLVFVNNGVKLTIEGSESLATLKEYEDRGLQILVCGTCLNYFNLLERKQVGQTANLLDIVTAMQLADKVINI